VLSGPNIAFISYLFDPLLVISSQLETEVVVVIHEDSKDLTKYQIST
jgi:hypothetical protein